MRKTKKTIIVEYRTKNNRDVRDLILAGYNGGIKKGRKGFATWESKKLSRFVSRRTRDSKGRFLPKETEVHPETSEGKANR